MAPLGLLFPLRPDPLQGIAECPLAHRPCQITLAQSAADPPDLKTTKGKGAQTELDVSPVQVLHLDHPLQRHLITTPSCARFKCSSWNAGQRPEVAPRLRRLLEVVLEAIQAAEWEIGLDRVGCNAPPGHCCPARSPVPPAHSASTVRKGAPKTAQIVDLNVGVSGALSGKVAPVQSIWVYLKWTATRLKQGPEAS